MVKYVFITGGVLSGLGKGITAASVAYLLKQMGLNVTAVKIDPYLNVDAGTMNPYMHGEVFVTEDGGETDLDIGHYERFLSQNLSRKNNITSGQIFHSVIEKERKGEYLGQCVQIIPHVTNEIKSRIRDVAREQGADVVVVEIGGTVGDIEGLPFLEAARQMRFEEGVKNTFYVHVALAPVLASGELKTKPIQHSVQELRRIGIQPDSIVVRSSRSLDDEARYKIALYSNVDPIAVFDNPDVDIVYKVPILLHAQGLTRYLAEKLGLEYREPELSPLKEFIEKLENATKIVRVALVGKYTKVKDSYISIVESLRHAAAHLGVKIELGWFESSEIEKTPGLANEVLNYDGVLVLPGFGKRGAEGKILAIRVARENNKPLLGICFGMQLMVVEYARNVAGLENANSTELDPATPHPVIDLLPGQREVDKYGASMRLGSKKIIIEPGTLAWRIYGVREVYERHRHRYGVNEKYLDTLEKAGLRASGLSEEGYVEIIEPVSHDAFYLGTQAHPEFKSRPLSPSPVYLTFLEHATRNR